MLRARRLVLVRPCSVGLLCARAFGFLRPRSVGLVGPCVRLVRSRVRLVGPCVRLVGPRVGLVGPCVRQFGPRVGLVRPCRVGLIRSPRVDRRLVRRAWAPVRLPVRLLLLELRLLWAH